ncbi:MAG TPA: hypothetical protein VEI97_12150 [bacterium]|nr:hypothetical protein [bacterium]
MTAAARLALAESITDFIATVSLEYGSFDRPLFHTLADWLGPAAEEMALQAILVPNTHGRPGTPNHEVIVIEEENDWFLYTAAYHPALNRGVIICARPPLDGTHTGRHVLLHATEMVFKTSLATPASPFLPEIPQWVRKAG